MTRSEKTAVIEEFKEKFEKSSFFYITDASTLTVDQTNNLRALCYENGIEMKVLKNTLARKAMEQIPEEKGLAALYDALKGPTAVMFTDVANAPARMIEEFRKTHERPILKAAYIDTDVYLGDDQLKSLSALKSKEELLGEIITLLQSPIKTVIGSLQSGGSTLSGLLKTLEERGE